MNRPLTEMSITELFDLRKDLEVLFEMAYTNDEDTTPYGRRAEEVQHELNARDN